MTDVRPLERREIVFLDDGYGARVTREVNGSAEGVEPCVQCGAATEWLFHREGDEDALPICTMICYRFRARRLYARTT